MINLCEPVIYFVMELLSIYKVGYKLIYLLQFFLTRIVIV